MEVWKEYNESPWGRIPKEWDLSCVKDETDVVTDYVANGSFASLAENVKYKSEEDYAVLIRLVDYNNQYKGDFVFIDKDAYEFLGKSKLYGDEIIISNVGANVGTVFKCPHLKYKMSLAPNSIMVKFKGDNDFYYYWLKSRFGQHMLQSIVTGSAQPKFNKTNFRDMAIPVPPIEEQRQIGMVLKSLDDKIEVNRRINDNLEQQAQALFKSWFVDFEPFKNQPFVESELGMIPQGWRVQGLGEVSRMNAGGDKPIVISDVPTELCKVPIYSNGLDNDGLYGFTNEARIIEPAVTISARGTIGDVNLRLTPYCPIVRLISIIPNPSIHVYYLYYALKNKRIEGVGTTQQQLTVPNFKREKIIIPTSGVIDSFKIILEPIIKKKRVNKIESRRLAELRDTLLPRLMSGELKVNDLENNEI